jgi:hypothetical protein
MFRFPSRGNLENHHRSLIMYPNFCIVEGLWDGLNIQYMHSEKTITKALVMYIDNTESLESNWLNYIPKKLFQDYLLISFTPFLFTQIFGQKIPVSHSPFIYKIEITNPSILHLAHLLQTEIKTPKILSQEFVFAIVTAMIRYCEVKKSAEIDIIDRSEVM